jgi:hypothetical protein
MRLRKREATDGERRGPGVWRHLGLLCALGLGSCAGLGTDVHLAPLALHMNDFDGGNTTEVAGGMGLIREPGPAGGDTIRALRPLISEITRADGTRIIDWLPPLGRVSWREDELVSYFFPIYTARSTPNSDHRKFLMLIMPGLLYTQEADGSDHFAWLPIYGDIKDFLTFDRIRFTLFPLYMRTSRAHNSTHHILFPIFSWTTPEVDEEGKQLGDMEGWRVWPLYGQIKREDKYDRRFALWPVFNLQENHLDRREEDHEHVSSVFPLFTRTSVGTYKGYTFLWPFFGYATDPRGDFFQLDAPWPLVRIQSGGQNTGDVDRFRIWPFYSHLIADRQETTGILWPLVSWSHEDYVGHDRDKLFMLPFWRGWTETIDRGERQGEVTASWKKLWPLWSQETIGPKKITTVTPLNPLMKSDFIDFQYGWIWQLYRSMEDGPNRTERSWLGLYWRQKNAVEDRKSLTGLWSSREVQHDDVHYTETSILFGLLRWRNSMDDVSDSGLMKPAFPGPGWPAMELPEGGVQVTPNEHEHITDLSDPMNTNQTEDTGPAAPKEASDETLPWVY